MHLQTTLANLMSCLQLVWISVTKKVKKLWPLDFRSSLNLVILFLPLQSQISITDEWKELSLLSDVHLSAASRRTSKIELHVNTLSIICTEIGITIICIWVWITVWEKNENSLPPTLEALTFQRILKCRELVSSKTHFMQEKKTWRSCNLEAMPNCCCQIIWSSANMSVSYSLRALVEIPQRA